MNRFSQVTSNINSPLPSSLSKECKKAAKILNSFVDPGQGLDRMIPPNILENAHGLAIYSVFKAGFLFSGRAGSGLVIARLPDNSWSAPSSIFTGGIGAGGQIGAELTDFILVLNSKDAVKTFSQFGNVTLGGNVSIAAGPLGRNAEASGSATYKNVAAIYAYSKTRGLFAGVSLEGSVIITRGDANEKLYGRKVTAKELLNGSISPPAEADALYRALNTKFHTLGNTGTNHQRTIEDGTASANYKNNNISSLGSLRQPPPTQQTPGYGTPSYSAHKNNAHNINGITNNDHGANYNANDYAIGGPPSYSPSAQIQQQPQSHFRRPPPPPPASRKPTRPRTTTPTARAVYSFAGEQDGDLSFKENEIIIIVQKSDSQDDWWTGKVGSKQGVFPANFVELQ
ncbi:hypothetical protein BCR42DRAFT_420395 [Absidia repens]|uniref:SH3 domain-containing protein n=1 Tax=Absidia repens TaxID=90262 RepID=A0A1X2IB30_9FUNG|nr:hypothetical protein BCR42DRAFT_420395 [Absidia repens]